MAAFSNQLTYLVPVWASVVAAATQRDGLVGRPGELFGLAVGVAGCPDGMPGWSTESPALAGVVQQFVAGAEMPPAHPGDTVPPCRGTSAVDVLASALYGPLTDGKPRAGQAITFDGQGLLVPSQTAASATISSATGQCSNNTVPLEHHMTVTGAPGDWLFAQLVPKFGDESVAGMAVVHLFGASAPPGDLVVGSELLTRTTTDALLRYCQVASATAVLGPGGTGQTKGRPPGNDPCGDLPPSAFPHLPNLLFPLGQLAADGSVRRPCFMEATCQIPQGLRGAVGAAGSQLTFELKVLAFPADRVVRAFAAMPAPDVFQVAARVDLQRYLATHSSDRVRRALEDLDEFATIAGHLMQTRQNGLPFFVDERNCVPVCARRPGEGQPCLTGQVGVGVLAGGRLAGQVALPSMSRRTTAGRFACRVAALAGLEVAPMDGARPSPGPDIKVAVTPGKREMTKPFATLRCLAERLHAQTVRAGLVAGRHALGADASTPLAVQAVEGMAGQEVDPDVFEEPAPAPAPVRAKPPSHLVVLALAGRTLPRLLGVLRSVNTLAMEEFLRRRIGDAVAEVFAALFRTPGSYRVGVLVDNVRSSITVHKTPGQRGTTKTIALSRSLATVGQPEGALAAEVSGHAPSTATRSLLATFAANLRPDNIAVQVASGVLPPGLVVDQAAAVCLTSTNGDGKMFFEFDLAGETRVPDEFYRGLALACQLGCPESDFAQRMADLVGRLASEPALAGATSHRSEAPVRGAWSGAPELESCPWQNSASTRRKHGRDLDDQADEDPDEQDRNRVTADEHWGDVAAFGEVDGFAGMQAVIAAAKAAVEATMASAALVAPAPDPVPPADKPAAGHIPDAVWSALGIPV